VTPHIHMKISVNELFLCLAITFLSLAAPSRSLGATASVSVINFAFVPATTNIAVGDRVIWTWGSGFHSTTSTDATPLWDSGLHPTPYAYTNTFNSAGSFPYVCTIHGFTGTVNVVAPNLPPSVTLTNPVAGTVFAAPANVTLWATATDSDGTVTNVQFLVGTNLVANVATAPFTATTNNLAAGSYTLSAIASDNLGATATNTVSISVVTPVPLTVGAQQRLSSTNFQFNYAANVGLSYIVQCSTNLLTPSWTTLVTNLATSNPMTFIDTNAVANPGFYRVGRLPNP